MYLTKTPYLLSALSRKQMLWSVDTQEKKLFLTFDDGPIPEVTPLVLDLLHKYNAKATFFMVGENATKYPELALQVKNEGHTIGNHTFNHLNSWSTPLNDYLTNVEKADQVLNTRFFRPPYGKIRLRAIPLLNKKYKVVMWSVLSADFDSNQSPENCFENIFKNAKSGSIIVMHDSIKAKNNMLFALEKTLITYSKLGFGFCSLDELLIIKD